MNGVIWAAADRRLVVAALLVRYGVNWWILARQLWNGHAGIAVPRPEKSMADVTIRRADQVDAAALGALHVASWHETYTGILPDEILAGLSVDARTAMWSKILGSPNEFGCAAVFVAEDDGRVVGFGSCGQQREGSLTDKGFSGEFSAIYVLRSHQGRGVGRSIIAAMSNELSAAGHTAACLWVLRQNAPARAFYEKLGGIVVDEKIDETPSGTLIEDAYGWRDLSPLAGNGKLALRVLRRLVGR